MRAESAFPPPDLGMAQPLEGHGVASRRMKEAAFECLALAVVLGSLLVLAWLLFTVVRDGMERLGIPFLMGVPSSHAEKAGALPAIAGTFYLMLLTAAIAFPLGAGAALYLEEYSRQNWLTRLIELNIANLAAVPSIVYGLLALTLFVRHLGLGRSLLTGAMTLSLLVLPVVVIVSREALRAVPQSIRLASLALGATRWQTIQRQVLPLALPGIMTGAILTLSRAIGETAPLITIGALTYVAFVPDGLDSPFTALPIQCFNWVSRPQKAFHANAAAAIVVLLAMLLALNAIAIWLRNRAQRRLQW